MISSYWLEFELRLLSEQIEQSHTRQHAHQANGAQLFIADGGQGNDQGSPATGVQKGDDTFQNEYQTQGFTKLFPHISVAPDLQTLALPQKRGA